MKVHNHGMYANWIHQIRWLWLFGKTGKLHDYQQEHTIVISCCVYAFVCCVLLEIFNSSIKRIACYYYTSTIIHHLSHQVWWINLCVSIAIQNKIYAPLWPAKMIYIFRRWEEVCLRSCCLSINFYNEFKWKVCLHFDVSRNTCT